LKRLSILLVTVSLAALLAVAQKGSRTLPTSKRLVSIPGRIERVNSFPVTLALSPDGRYAAMLHDGYGTQQSKVHQSISVLDLSSNKLSDFPDDRLGEDAHQSYYVGLAFSPDGKHLYASLGSITDPTGAKTGDTGNAIAVYTFSAGKVAPERLIKIAPQKLASGKYVAKGVFTTPKGTAVPYPSGIAVVPGSSERLLVANNLADNVIVLDAASGNVLKSFDLSTTSLVPSAYPYTVVASRDGRRAWCSLWNASRVAELDLEAGNVARSITLQQPDSPTAPGSHPTAMLLSPDEKQLYVALSNTDLAVAIDTATGQPSAWFSTRLPNQRYPGTSPVGLALSHDARRLYVAAATLNAIAVFDVTHPEGSAEKPQSALGFTPTDWYPSVLAVQGNDLLVATAKGQGTGPNNAPNGFYEGRRRREHPYIPTLLYGSIARIHLRETEKDLASLTAQVEDRNLLRTDPGKLLFRGGQNPIKHAIYIIKENRTYDQVFGDLGVGDGDPSLTMYGEEVTPNEHKLARQFGILDYFYASGEVSGDGHVWSTAAITSDYNERNWQITYRGHERTYDFGGMVADEVALDHGVPNLDSPQTGYLWANAAQHGLTYRNYGEFIWTRFCTDRAPEWVAKEGNAYAPGGCDRKEIHKGEPLPSNVGQPKGSPSPYPWGIPLWKSAEAPLAELREHTDLQYPEFNVDYPDQLRADEFLNEFAEFVKARQEGKGTELPNLITMHLPNDHTGGTRPGKPTPAASVADNDLALARIVEAVSHSPYWDDTAIIILEDDAQDGADHVDAHRSLALLISKYAPSSPKPVVDHSFYTTVNVVRTMEALLGLPAMNLNDGYAPLMTGPFSGPGNQPPFTADTRNLDNGFIYRTNPKTAPGAKQSERMDFNRPDAADAHALNAILWRDRKGNTPMPAPRHTVIPATAERDGD
jgi:DNA-binding beta-propeller fold protein YncE